MTNQSKPIANKKSKRGVRFGVSFAVLVLMVVSPVSAFAQGEPGGGGSSGSGLSTPGVTVTANNPGTSPLGSNLRLTLTAHSAKSTVTNPSCRPPDPTLRCWGSLVLRIPELGGMSVKGFYEVHRVAVGDISCGDDENGGCGDEGGGCGDENGGCGDTELAATSPVEQQLPLQAQVNGLGVVTNPGTATLPNGQPVTPGMQVQVKITLTDNGTAEYKDTAYVVVNQFQPGPTKPNIYTSPNPPKGEVIQQVGIHFLGHDGS